MVMSLLYFVTQSIRVSSTTKMYKNALEASYGGSEIVAFEVIDKAFKDYTLFSTTNLFQNISFNLLNSNCFKQKLELPSSGWTQCSADEKDFSLAKIKTAPDMTFNLKGQSLTNYYQVYSKIVDTSAGNTDTTPTSSATPDDSGGLLTGSGAGYKKSGNPVDVQHIPYTYRFEVQGESAQNTQQKSNLTVLYAY